MADDTPAAAGTPDVEVQLIAAAIEVAAGAPLRRGTYSCAALVPWPDITRLRETLDAAGIDWRAVKAARRG